MPTFDRRLQPTQAPHRETAGAREAGRALRRHIPRSAHAVFASPERDPLRIIAEQNENRVPELVPLRIGRMLRSPFAFYRGTAGLMAADLAEDTTTGLDVVACGDAHISNFGLYASPQRNLVFDLNDFDEATVAPWEWDVKRLVTSVVVGARENGYSESRTRKAAAASAGAYRTALREIAGLSALERYYFRADTDMADSGRWKHLDPGSIRVLERAVQQARRKTGDRYLEKVSRRDSAGRLRLVEAPPVLTHVEPEIEAMVEDLLATYQETLPLDLSILLGQFRVSDLARRVVGVGSVGTRCYIVVLSGPDREALILQVKEAPASVLSTYGRMPEPARLLPDGTREPLFRDQGHRVVATQRVLQAVSDPFLGHFSSRGRDYYVRQFRDRKGSIETTGLRPREYTTYVESCGIMLARAHAQSASGGTIAAYLGGSASFDEAVVEWSLAYAERSRADFERLRSAVERGLMAAVIED